MLNDTVFVECAEALADRIDSELSDDSKQSLAQAYQLVTGRIADAETINTLNQLYEDTKMHSPDSAWTVVAQVLLNLDESLTF
jgi:DNA-binding transcriptional regulator YbjK